MPGFLVNRMLGPFINEAVFALMESTGTAEDIDTGARLGLNHPMGPLELSDFIGNDVMLGVMDVLYRGFGDPKFRAAPLLRQMVTAGHLGPQGGPRLLSLRREREQDRLMVDRGDRPPGRTPSPSREEERAGSRHRARNSPQRELAPTAAQRDEEERYDRALFDGMAELGLTGLPYPEKYGGAGMGTFAVGPGLRGDRRGRHGDGGEPLGPRPGPAAASWRTEPTSRRRACCRP